MTKLVSPILINAKGSFGLNKTNATSLIAFPDKRFKQELIIGTREEMEAEIKNITSHPFVPKINLQFDFNGIIMPGLKDNHAHPVSYSIIGSLNPIMVFGSKNKKEILETLAKEIPSRNEKGIILSYGLNTMLVNDLTSKDLDTIESKKPLIVFDPSYHSAVVNSQALKLISRIAEEKKKELKKEFKGTIFPNGSLTEDYVFLAFELMDSYFGKNISESAENQSKLIISYLENMQKKGITSCNDLFISTPSQLLAVLIAKMEWEIKKEIKFPIDEIYLRPDLILSLLKKKEKYSDILKYLKDWLDQKRVGLKFFSDGSFGSHTAHLSKKYSDIEIFGTIFEGRMDVISAITLMQDFNIQKLRIHAIGDKGVINAIEMINTAKVLSGEEIDAGIEHFELSDYSYILTLAKKLKIKVCMQPNFNSDIYDYSERLDDRILKLNPLRDIFNLNIPMTFGTDGMPQSMLFALFSAINHPNPQQSLSLEQALPFAADLDPTNLIVVSENAFNTLKRVEDPEQIKRIYSRSYKIAQALDQSISATIIQNNLFLNH